MFNTETNRRIVPKEILSPKNSKRKDIDNPSFIQEIILNTGSLIQYANHVQKEDYKQIKPDEIYNLANGVVRIINFVKANHIDTLFFLDKSARPAGYFFLKTWAELEYPLKRPDIKFIHIGRRTSPDNTPSEIKEIQNRFPISDKRIAVIDDIIETGKTIIKAKKLMENCFPEKTIYYTCMFDQIPSWYSEVSSLGVVDQNSSEDSTPLLSKPYKKQEIFRLLPHFYTLSHRKNHLRQDLSNLSGIIPFHTIKINTHRITVLPSWIGN